MTMDSVWMKNLSVPFTYSSRRKIFLQGCPPEMWHSHARWPVATLPTRFSIKQANNTIPTPINKWSFLNKVLYTEPLAEATHHTLMKPCTSQSYFFPSFYIYEESRTKSVEVAETREAEAFRSSSYHYLAQHWLRYSTIYFKIYEAINMRCPHSFTFTHTKNRHFYASTHKLKFPYFLSFWRQVVHSSLNIQSVGSPDAWASVNVVLLLASFWWDLHGRKAVK